MNKSVFRCIVVDDDSAWRLILKKFVGQTEQLQLAGEFSNAKDAAAFIDTEKVDIAFIDIEMPGMSGMDLIKSFTHSPHIVLVTGKREYAAEAFDYNVTDFLVKPVTYERFVKAVSKVREINESVTTDAANENANLFVKKDGVLVKVAYKDISYIEALADYVNIYTDKGRFTVLSTMKAMEEKLPAQDFLRVHRSFIVRFDRIQSVEKGVALYVGEKQIPISRTYKDAVMMRLNLL